MDWSTFFDDLFVPQLSDHQQNSAIRRMDREIHRLRAAARPPQGPAGSAQDDLRAEIEVLHANFARALLLLQALTTTALRKQLISREELQAVIQEIDLLDGEPDNALDPAALPGMQPRRSPESLEAVAERALSEADSTSPREFLKQLENRDQPHQ